MRAVASGRDALVVMPTGSGKSAIYQLAGKLLSGPTIVVSPLIALQRDQLADMDRQAAGSGAQLNSTLTDARRREVLYRFRRRELEFVLLAPEQLANEETLADLHAARPSLVAVDEAHCISDWGHDFRPEYLQLAVAIEDLGRPTVLALTATAAPAVRDEIVERLGLADPAVIVRGFDRPNIHLAVSTFEDERSKRRALVRQTLESARRGIVYVSTRRRAEEIAELLRAAGVRTTHYHAGLRAAEREEAQQRFMDDDVEVMVATTAFGMGIDKPNVRFVFHADVPDSVDAYYQEVGRAGRDGEPAHALLLFRPGDLGIRRFFAAGGGVDRDDIERVGFMLREAGQPIDLEALEEESGLSNAKLTTALNRLKEEGVVRALRGGRVAWRRGRRELEQAAERAADADERHRLVERTRVDMMRAYAETRDCRREYVLNYFGEGFAPPCGRCDNCDDGLTDATTDAEDQPLDLNDRVTHASFGPGTVVRYEGAHVVVLFERVGYRTLRTASALSRGLLRATDSPDQPS